MTRVVVVGSKGRVGSRIVAGLRGASDLTLAGEVDLGDDLEKTLRASRADVAIDFTTPKVVFANVRTILSCGVHAVVGTTGLAPDQLSALDGIAREKKVACLIAPNFALGAVLMMRFAEEAARHFPWVEIVERHHEKKLDAPSGTAALTARRIAKARSEAPAPAEETESAPGARGGRVDEVPVHSLRLPGSLAHQEVYFGGPGETLVIRHDATDRDAYLPGVLLAARRIGGRAGLIPGLENLLWPGN